MWRTLNGPVRGQAALVHLIPCSARRPQSRDVHSGAGVGIDPGAFVPDLSNPLWWYSYVVCVLNTAYILNEHYNCDTSNEEFVSMIMDFKKVRTGPTDRLLETLCTDSCVNRAEQEYG